MMLGLALSPSCKYGIGAPLLAQNFVAVGDSLTFGEHSTDPSGTTSYPYVVATNHGLVYDDTVRNVGVSGLWSGALPDVDYLLVANKSNVLALLIGNNDIYFLTDSAAVIFARIKAYADARIAVGWRVIFATLTGNGNFSAAMKARAVALNALIKDAYGVDISVVDVAADPNIGSDAVTFPSSYYNADQTHLSDSGYALLGALIAKLVTSAPAPPAAIFGTTISADLRIWMRDWITTPATPAHEAFDLFSLSFPRAYPSTGGASGLTMSLASTTEPASVVPNVLNGRSVIRYTAAADLHCFHGLGGGHFLFDIITASSFLVHAVFSPSLITSDTGLVYTNHGLITDVGGNFGLYLRKDTATGNYKIMGYANPGDYATYVESATNLTLNSFIAVSFRRTGGKVGIRVGTTSAWEEVTCADLSDLTGPFKIGSNGYTAAPFAHQFKGDLADLIIRNAWSSSKDASDTAYLRARYGIA